MISQSSSARPRHWPLPPAGELPEPPSLLYAVYLMWAGAGLALLGTILTVTDGSSLKAEAFRRARINNDRASGAGGYTVAQLHQVASITFIGLVVAGIISVLLWAWIAWAASRGRGWARTFASVLFGLLTVEMLVSASRGVSIIFIVLEWVVGLAAIVLLWRRETTAYLGAG
jgi:hypothetical protein